MEVAMVVVVVREDRAVVEVEEEEAAAVVARRGFFVDSSKDSCRFCTAGLGPWNSEDSSSESEKSESSPPATLPLGAEEVLREREVVEGVRVAGLVGLVVVGEGVVVGDGGVLDATFFRAA